jgi:hypothetical protein
VTRTRVARKIEPLVTDDGTICHGSWFQHLRSRIHYDNINTEDLLRVKPDVLFVGIDPKKANKYRSLGIATVQLGFTDMIRETISFFKTFMNYNLSRRDAALMLQGRPPEK